MWRGMRCGPEGAPCMSLIEHRWKTGGSQSIRHQISRHCRDFRFLVCPASLWKTTSPPWLALEIKLGLHIIFYLQNWPPDLHSLCFILSICPATVSSHSDNYRNELLPKQHSWKLSPVGRGWHCHGKVLPDCRDVKLHQTNFGVSWTYLRDERMQPQKEAILED